MSCPDRAFPLRAAGNTSPLSWPASSRAWERTSRVRLVRGTWCILLAFIRSAGTVQVAVGRYISGQTASLTSLERAAVSTRNSKASLVAGSAVDSLTALSAAGTSPGRRDRW